MAGKKKDMKGGLSLSQKKPVINEPNINLIIIKKLAKTYQKINPSNILVNNLNVKVKSLNKFSKNIKNNEHLIPLLVEVKKILKDKILESIEEFKNSKILYSNINFSELLDRLKEFEKLLNQLKLLDNQFDLSFYSPDKQNLIQKTFIKYEKYIQNILYRNPNTNLLQELKQEVQNYIKEYSEFIESMTNNRKINNPIYELINSLKTLSDEISIKIYSSSSNRTLNNTTKKLNQETINRLSNYNSYQKSINYNRILGNLHDKYKSNSQYSLTKLINLAHIGSTFESINRMPNGSNKNILLEELRKKIKQSKNSLNKYSEFQEYEKMIPANRN